MPKYVVKKNGVVYEGGTLQTTNNFVSVTADGVKTSSQLMDDLYALIDFNLLTRDATLIRIDEYNRTKILRLEDIDAQNSTKNLNFTSAYARKEHERMLITYRIQSSGSVFGKHDLDGGTFTDISSSVPTSGTIFILYYSSAVALDNTQGSGGHTIWNAIKTALTQRTKLWFADAKVTDDSTEQATKVEVVQLIDDESELTNAPDGVYQGDYEDAPEDVLDASMVAYKEGSVEDALDDRDAFTTIDYVIGASSGSNVDSRTTDLTQFKKIALGYTYGEASYIGYTEIPIDLFKRSVTLTVYNPMNTAYYIQAVWSDNTKVKLSYNVAANYRAVILGIK